MENGTAGFELGGVDLDDHTGDEAIDEAIG